MKRDLKTILADIAEGKKPSAMLLFGDDLQVQEACRAIVDLVVPESQRDFNLERFDGRSVAWDQVQASLMTPPFFPGTKVVWVENAPYFFSREQKGELSQQVVQLWSEGKRDEASKLLIDLLVVEGWTEEQWLRLDSGSSLAPVIELLDVGDDEGRETAAALVAYCRSKGMTLGQGRGSEAHGLEELLEGGVPPWDLLLLTAVQVDRRTRLYKKFDDKGVVVHLALERARSGRVDAEKLAEFINQRIRDAGKKIAPQARELILLRAGEDLRTLSQELEKLLVYIGDQPTIGVHDVEAIFVDQGAAWIFDLTRSVAARDAVAALSQLARLLAKGDHPLRILATLASEVRRLLAARQLIDGEMRGRWQRGMSYGQFQQHVLKEGTAFLTRNPYADYMCFQRADHFSPRELLAHLHNIHAADLRLKSSGGNPRLLMDRLILSMCLGSQTSGVLTEQATAR